MQQTRFFNYSIGTRCLTSRPVNVYHYDQEVVYRSNRNVSGKVGYTPPLFRELLINNTEERSMFRLH